MDICTQHFKIKFMRDVANFDGQMTEIISFVFDGSRGLPRNRSFRNTQFAIEISRRSHSNFWSIFHGTDNDMNFYREAARILDDLGTKKNGSLKSIIFDPKAKRAPANQKRLYALVSETLKRFCHFSVQGWFLEKEVLERVIESSELLKVERKVCCFVDVGWLWG